MMGNETNTLKTKQLWRLFVILILLASLVATYAVHRSWQRVNNKYSSKQEHVVELSYQGTASLLKQYDMTLDYIKKQLFHKNNQSIYPDAKTTQTFFEEVVKENPSVLSVYLLNKDGKLLFASPNHHYENYLKNDKTKESFMRAIIQPNLVLNRTIKKKAYQNMTFAIHKRIQPTPKDTYVLTLLIDADKAFSFLKNSFIQKEGYKLSIIRKNDLYIQIAPHLTGLTSEFMYNLRIPSKFMKTFIKAINKKYKYTHEDYQHQQANKRIIHITHKRLLDPSKNSLVTLKFNPDYQLIIMSQLFHEKIKTDFYERVLLIAIFYFTFLFILLIFILYVRKQNILKMKQKLAQDTKQTSTSEEANLVFINAQNMDEVLKNYKYFIGRKLLIEIKTRMKSLKANEYIVLEYGKNAFHILKEELKEEFKEELKEEAREE